MNDQAIASAPSAPRKRYRRAERLDWAQRFLASGLTQREFTQQYGLAGSNLSRWVAQARHATQPAHPQSSALFREIPLPGSPATASWVAELVQPNGHILRLAGPLSTQLLAQLLSVC